jgi:adhesin transport system membrane fusion protein
MSRTSETDALGKRLTLPLGLVNEGRVKLFRSLTYVCSVFVVAVTAWSAVAEFREVAIAQGQIVPLSDTQKVHHLEGGIVEQIYVSEGQEVKSGAPILRLRPEGAEADLEQLKAQLASARLEHIRLEALLTGQKPDFSGFDEAYARIKQEQAEFYAKTVAKDAEDREKLRLELLQARGELSALGEERKGLQQQLQFESEQVAIRQKSFSKGYTSRIAFLEAQSRHGGLQAKLASIASREVELTAKVREAEQAPARAEADRLQKLADDRSKVIAEIVEKQNALKKYQDRVARLVVRSPDHGIVHLLVQRTPGEVVKPGDLVAEVVPYDGEMIAEVHLAVKDIGHVKAGAPANLKAVNYDPTGMEVATGRVSDISATTFQTKDGQPFYRVRIKLDQPFVGPAERGWRLLPGMVVEADVITGKKSLIRYMLRPVYRSLSTAMSER